MRKVAIGFVLFAFIGAAAYLRFRKPGSPLETAYAGNRQVTLWSTTAQVREPVGTLGFGDRVKVLSRFDDNVEVRTQAGATGWVDKRDLLSAELWDSARELAKKAETMPVEAHGHTAVLSNMHVEPGRQTPRIEQLLKDVPVELLARQVVAYQKEGDPNEEEVSTAGTDQPRMEDWWLVRAKTPEEGTVAGWVLGRFVELDVPQPLPDYADSAGMRIVSWFELKSVRDAASGAREPEYLVLGTKGPEGQACDFSMIRVYTWSSKHSQYETAFVDGDVCGKLPLSLARSAAPDGDITFSFQDWSNGPPEPRVYRMRQTIVRRVGESKRDKEKARKRERH